MLRKALGYTCLGLHYLGTAMSMALAVLLSPLLVLLFYKWNKAFLVVMTELWPHLDILDDKGVLYLRRFFMTPKTQWFHPRFLHFIARSDEGRDPHDHPAAFKTRILYGGYMEAVYLPVYDYLRSARGTLPVAHRAAVPGTVLENPEGHTHMVTLLAPTWSWVVAWKRGKPWGFWRLSETNAQLDRWISSEEYGKKGQEIKSWEWKPWF